MSGRQNSESHAAHPSLTSQRTHTSFGSQEVQAQTMVSVFLAALFTGFNI